MELFVRFLSHGISFVALVTSLTLVVFMLAIFGLGAYDTVLMMLETVWLDPAERQVMVGLATGAFLHTIATLVVFMAAYRLLAAYVEHHQIDLKYVIEITVTVSVLELLFNATAYTEHVQLVFGGLALGGLAIYAFKFDVFSKALKETEKRTKERRS